MGWFGKSYCFVAAKDEREFVFLCYCFWNFWLALRLHCEKPSYREEPSLIVFNVHFSQCSTLTLKEGVQFSQNLCQSGVFKKCSFGGKHHLERQSVIKKVSQNLLGEYKQWMQKHYMLHTHRLSLG